MRTLTLVIYALFGGGAILGGIAAIVSPAVILPATAMTPLAQHLAREEGAATPPETDTLTAEALRRPYR